VCSEAGRDCIWGANKNNLAGWHVAAGLGQGQAEVVAAQMMKRKEAGVKLRKWICPIIASSVHSCDLSIYFGNGNKNRDFRPVNTASIQPYQDCSLKMLYTLQ
jgi:hypothetical protein